MKFTAWALFVALWATVVYFPVAHWVWGTGGWAFELGVIDFAGGTAVHINAGAAALGVILVIGKRVGFKKDPMRPHSLPLVMLGAGLLWFGWFGFNAGSWLGNDDGVGALMFINTQIATAAAMLAWLVVREDPPRRVHHAGCRLRRGRRSGRHHPVRWCGLPARRDRRRRHRRCRSAPWPSA